MPRRKAGLASFPELDEQNGTLPPLDPIITGLLDRLPEPGAVWAKPERQKWIALLQMTIDLIYADEQPK